MPSHRSCVLRWAAALLCALAPLGSHAKETETGIQAAAPIAVQQLGKGTVPLEGPWRFQPGDSAEWASPSFDDSTWKTISADRTWGMQGYNRLTGIAWYRATLDLSPASDLPAQFSLLVPRVYDAYEVYWNGNLIGKSGNIDGIPVWYPSPSPQVYPLGRTQHGTGVLALRVWKAPLFSDDSGETGGFDTPPLVGSPQDIETARAALNYHWLSSRQFLFGENLLYTLVALLSFLLWSRNSRRRLLFWMTGFTIVPPLIVLLLELHIRWPYAVAMGIDQPLTGIRDTSLWFLLLNLLRIQDNRVMLRLTRILAAIFFLNTAIDGLLIFLSWNANWIGVLQLGDAISAVIFSTLQAFPIVLAGYALLRRQSLGSSRMLLAIVAFLTEMLLVVQNVLKQGRQFTNWSIGADIDAPLVSFAGSSLSVSTLTGSLLLIAVIYAVYDSIREDQRRQDRLERERAELMHAREQMRYHAEHDGLTGIWNHRIIVERLNKEVQRSARDGSPLSVILADVDHFKKINDGFGHPTGDMVLKEISGIFIQCLRTYDWVGRYGGEEFLLILPGSDLESATARAEQLRRAIQDAEIVDGATTLRVTASFGVAAGMPVDFDAERVIRAVDAALYRAKRNGRNCVIAEEMIQSPLGI